MAKQSKELPRLVKRMMEFRRLCDAGLPGGVQVIIEICYDEDSDLISCEAFSLLLGKYAYGLTTAENAEQHGYMGRYGTMQRIMCKALQRLRARGKA